MTLVRRSGWLTWLHLVRVFTKIHYHSLGKLQEYDLTPAKLDVLTHLSNHPGLTQQELAEKLLVTKGNVCGLLNRLEKDGLVERQSDPEDKRANRLFLTEQAVQLAAEVIPGHRDFIEKHLSCLSERELHSLHTLLRDLDHSLKHHEE
jgi:DNA-binding MarR family transcriptional regulator